MNNQETAQLPTYPRKIVLETIDSKDTIHYIFADGTHAWVNKNVKAILLSTGEILNIKTLKPLLELPQERVAILMRVPETDELQTSRQFLRVFISFSNLFKRMVAHFPDEPLRKQVDRFLLEHAVYGSVTGFLGKTKETQDILTLVAEYSWDAEDATNRDSEKEFRITTRAPSQQGHDLFEDLQGKVELQVLNDTTLSTFEPQLFTVEGVDHYFVTSDGKSFHNNIVASTHEHQLSIAFDLANSVLLHDTTLADLAEEVYQKAMQGEAFISFQELTTRGFVGVQDKTAGGYASFKGAKAILEEKGINLQYVSPRLFTSTYDFEQAEKLQSILEAFIEAAQDYSHALVHLKKLTTALNVGAKV